MLFEGALIGLDFRIGDYALGSSLCSGWVGWACKRGCDALCQHGTSQVNVLLSLVVRYIYGPLDELFPFVRIVPSSGTMLSVSL